MSTRAPLEERGPVAGKEQLTAAPADAVKSGSFEIPDQMRFELERLPANCPICNATIGPVAAKVWSEAAQTSNLALYECPHCGHRWTCAWPTVALWLTNKPETVQTFAPPAPVAKTIDQKPVYRKVIDVSKTDILPPDGTTIYYDYLYTKSGNRVSGSRHNHVEIRARWKDETGQPYRWMRVFEDRATAMAFGRKWEGIDGTRT